MATRWVLSTSSTNKIRIGKDSTDYASIS